MSEEADIQPIKPTGARSGFKWGWVLRKTILVMLLLPVVLAALLPIYLVPAIGQPFYNLMLFHPWKYPNGLYTGAAMLGIEPADQYFTAEDGSKLHGWLFRVPGARHVVLLSDGNGGNMTYRRAIALKFIQNRESVFMYDYRGYGRSEGEPSMEGIRQDGLAAYNYLKDGLHYLPRQIILCGESLGTVVTGYLAPRVESAGIVVQCPLYSFRRRAQELVPILNIYSPWMWPAGGLDISSAFSGKHAPLLIISGTADPMTPVKHADDLFAGASEPKMYVRIKGGGHGDPSMMAAHEYDIGLRKFLSLLS